MSKNNEVKIATAGLLDESKVTFKELNDNIIEYKITLIGSKYPNNTPHEIKIKLPNVFPDFEEELLTFIEFYGNLYKSIDGNTHKEILEINARKLLTPPFLDGDNFTGARSINFKDEEFLKDSNISNEVKILGIILLHKNKKIASSEVELLEDFNKEYKNINSSIYKENIENYNLNIDLFFNPILHWSLYKNGYKITSGLLESIKNFNYSYNIDNNLDLSENYFKALDLWLFIYSEKDKNKTLKEVSKEFRSNKGIPFPEDFYQMTLAISPELSNNYRIIQNNIENLINISGRAFNKLQDLTKLEVLELLEYFPKGLTVENQVKVTNYIISELTGENKSTPQDAIRNYNKINNIFPRLTSQVLIKVHNDLMSNYKMKAMSNYYFKKIMELEGGDYENLENLHNFIWSDSFRNIPIIIIEMLMRTVLLEDLKMEDLNDVINSTGRFIDEENIRNKYSINFAANFILFYIDNFEEYKDMPLEWCLQFFMDKLTNKKYIKSDTEILTFKNSGKYTTNNGINYNVTVSNSNNPATISQIFGGN